MVPQFGHFFALQMHKSSATFTLHLHPFVHGRNFIGEEFVQQSLGGGVFQKHPPVGFLDESCGRRTVEKRQQRVEISVYIDKPARFSVQPELGPSQQFRHFFYGAESSGQGDESVGQPEHGHLSFVHGVNDAQFRQAPMGNPVREGSGDDSGDPPARTQNGVGDSHSPLL